MMPLHSLLFIGCKASRSSHADLNGAARADGKPAHGNTLGALPSECDETQDSVDRLIVTKAICKEFRYSDNVNDVRHILPRCGQREDWKASKCDALQNCDAGTKYRGASSLTEHKCGKLTVAFPSYDARNLIVVAVPANLAAVNRVHIQDFDGALA